MVYFACTRRQGRRENLAEPFFAVRNEVEEGTKGLYAPTIEEGSSCGDMVRARDIGGPFSLQELRDVWWLRVAFRCYGNLVHQ